MMVDINDSGAFQRTISTPSAGRNQLYLLVSPDCLKMLTIEKKPGKPPLYGLLSIVAQHLQNHDSTRDPKPTGAAWPTNTWVLRWRRRSAPSWSRQCHLRASWMTGTTSTPSQRFDRPQLGGSRFTTRQNQKSWEFLLLQVVLICRNCFCDFRLWLVRFKSLQTFDQPSLKTHERLLQLPLLKSLLENLLFTDDCRWLMVVNNVQCYKNNCLLVTGNT